MTDERDLDDVRSRRVVSPEQAERILSGAINPDDLRVDVAEVAHLLRAARGPATLDEYGSADVANLARRIRMGARAPIDARARFGHRITRKAAAFAVVGAFFTAGAAAAATGTLPGPIQRTLSHAYSHFVGDMPVVRSTSATTDGAAPTSTPVGPDATGPAQSGLCTAYLASGGKNDKAVAFQNLTNAAKDAGQTVEQFCSSTSSTSSSSTSSSVATTVTTTKGVGPDVTGPAKDGLCTAYLASEAGNGKNMDAVAFRNLAAAAATAGQTIDAFCGAPSTPTTANGSTTTAASTTSTTAKVHGKP